MAKASEIEKRRNIRVHEARRDALMVKIKQAQDDLKMTRMRLAEARKRK